MGSPTAGKVEVIDGVIVRNGEHVPTAENRANVKAWAMIAHPIHIANKLGIHEDTLWKHYEHELDSGIADAVITVGTKLLQKAIAGDMTAMIFFLKTRGRLAYTQFGDRADMLSSKPRRFDLTGIPMEDLFAAIPVLEKLLGQVANDDESTKSNPRSV